MTQRTFCRICEAACGLTVDEGRLRPDRAHPLSRGFVCAKGTRFGEVASHPARLLRPQLGPPGARREVGWSEALDDVVSHLRRTIERHGPHAVGIYAGNPLAFHGAGQLAAAFFAQALGTRNVFSASSQDCNNKFAAGELVHGSPALQPIPDFEHAEAAILFGTNPAVSQSSFVHLEGGSTVFDRMRDRGAPMYWVDVRRTESARRWGELVRVRPGTDAFLILALLGLWADRAPADDVRVEGLAPMLELARAITPARAEAMTGVPAATIEALARVLERPTALHLSVGVNQGPFGTLSYVAMQALAYASGNLDARGGSVFSPVAVGFSRLAPRLGLFTQRARSRVGGFPAVFDTLPGGVMADEILTEGPDRVRAMIVIAGDPVRSVPGSDRLERALGSLDYLACLEMFESRTGAHAHALLPCTSWLERADFALPSMPLQTSDLLQTTAAVAPRPGEARPEHEILADLALALDRPLLGQRWLTRALATEGLVDRALPRLVDLAWRLLDRHPSRRGLGVKVPTPRPGSYLGRGPLTEGRRVRFWDPRLDVERARLEAWRPPTEGFVLLGRRRRLGHNSWLRGGTRDGRPEPAAWLSPADLRRLGLDDGDEITLRTSHGTLRVPARAEDGVADGTVVVPHGEWDTNVNALLPAGPGHIEPASGMLVMTGIPVEVRVDARLDARAPA